MSNEQLWEGTFGDQYTVRNDVDMPRADWWHRVCQRYDFANVLEVGCNVGHNLRDIAQYLDEPSLAWGMDINSQALKLAKQRYPDINFVRASGLDIPFRDQYFDMVFTAGVLIHQTPETVQSMMQEIIRVSAKYVMSIEYESDVFEEIPYRGQSGALFKGPWGEVYEKRYGLRLLEKVELGREHGFDFCTATILTAH